MLGKLLGTLVKAGLPLIGNVLKPSAKSNMVLLGLTVAASVTAAAIQKKTFGSETTTLIISDEEMKMTSINEIVNPLQDVEGEKNPPNNFSPVLLQT